MLRIERAIREKLNTLPITFNTLIAKIDGHSLFSLFTDNMNVLRQAKDKIDDDEFEEAQDTDERAIDHPLRRKVAQILSHYEPVEYRVIEMIQKHYQPKLSKDEEPIEVDEIQNAIETQIWLQQE